MRARAVGAEAPAYTKLLPREGDVEAVGSATTFATIPVPVEHIIACGAG